MNAPHIEAIVRVERTHAAMVESLMNSQGALAVTLTDCTDTPILEPPLGETPLWDEVVISGLFSADIDSAALVNVLRLLPAVSGPASVQVTEVADQAWERVWMDRFQPMRFGRRLWIVPTGHEPPDPEGINLLLDPGLAFGTGTHPTTRLCLEWIDAQDLSGRTVVDFGCGSGVLGVAAALQGAERVICFDHDPQAVRATQENARRNGVAGQLEARLADKPPAIRADIVISNILAGILVSLARPLQAMLQPGGQMALTGILQEQADEVAAAYAERFPRLKRSTIDDWVLLAGTADEAA